MGHRSTLAAVLLLVLWVALPAVCCAVGPTGTAGGHLPGHHRAAGHPSTALEAGDAHCAAPEGCCERVAGALLSSCCEAAPGVVAHGQAERWVMRVASPLPLDAPTALPSPAIEVEAATHAARGGPLYTLHSSLLI